MNPDTYGSVEPSPALAKSTKVRSVAFYIFIATVVISPFAFWPSPYIALESIKTFVIGIGVLLSAILLGVSIIREKSITLPPKRIVWTSLLLVASLIISAILSVHVGKSLFGQGFELNTTSFISITFLAALAAFFFVEKRVERGVLIYIALFTSYFVVYIYHLVRLLFGASFASFSVFLSQTSSAIGGWYNLGTLSVLIGLLSLSAIVFLPLSRKMKFLYWLFAILSFVGMIVVNYTVAWTVAFLVLLGMTVFLSIKRVRAAHLGFAGSFKKLAWIPLIACVIVGVLAWKGTTIVSPVIESLGVPYAELSLPWDMTLDVTGGAIKQSPIFGVGPNHFVQSLLQNKPDALNLTNAWNVEFSYGFGFIPTLIAEQGIVGLVLWVLFFIFFGMMGVRAIKGDDVKSTERFVIISSFTASVFLWLMAIISIPSHVIFLLTLIMTGIFFGSSVYAGTLNRSSVVPCSRGGKTFFMVIMAVVLLIALAWGLVFFQKIAALTYFGQGVKQLSLDNNPDKAIEYFTKANGADYLDVYMQAKAEAELTKANMIATQASKETNASTSEALVTQFAALVNTALVDSRNAITYDPSDYVNYISEARVSEVAANLKMQNAYESAVQAYVNAANLNPKNPAIYLNLAKLEVSQSKLDDAVKSLGAALQVKPNYTEAVFTLSQVYAAKGDLDNAIVAAKFAAQLNPENPQVYFQLGLLQFSNKLYSDAATSLGQAVKIQPDYANAQYFLGLADARLGKSADAIAQFTGLAKTNPDNQEVQAILQRLNSGQSIFNDPVSLPIKTTK